MCSVDIALIKAQAVNSYSNSLREYCCNILMLGYCFLFLIEVKVWGVVENNIFKINWYHATLEFALYLWLNKLFVAAMQLYKASGRSFLHFVKSSGYTETRLSTTRYRILVFRFQKTCFLIWAWYGNAKKQQYLYLIINKSS